MDSITWAEAFENLLKVRGVERGQGTRNDKTTSATVAQVAKEIGVSRRTAFRRLHTAEKLNPHPDLKEKVRRGEMEKQQQHRVPLSTAKKAHSVRKYRATTVQQPCKVTRLAFVKHRAIFRT